ncbi:MAG: carboxylesterase/lipase family protein [Chloroflexota bacterium]|nr:carboxylesterase/lipase family protein [Chloroflexota bacterium]
MKTMQSCIMGLTISVFLLAACVRPTPLPGVQPPSPTRIALMTPADLATPITIEAGQLQGVVENNVVSFKGIPYAAPPVGDLRWRAPQPAATWPAVRPADAYGNACIQQPGLSAKNGGEPGPLSEDCLYLNIWTPRPGPTSKLPVMVWIHGGGYVFGAGGLEVYDGAPLASQGAVVVNFNYRLGQLGFFVHPALDKESPNGPANFGLLDQIAALTWVQQNIAQFGGDANNVTIFGQSAGAKSVLALFASPLARGLFHKGIAQSSYIIPDTPRAKALEKGIKIAEAVGLNGAEATIANLRAVPAEKFAQLAASLSYGPIPISGDTVLPQSIQDTFAAGEEAPLPLIVGNTSNDVSVTATFGVDPATVLERLGVAGILVKALYPGVNDDRELARLATRDVVFTMPARWVADRHAKLAPTWRYYFDYNAVNQRPDSPNGVAHGNDTPYFLDTGDIAPSTRDIFSDEDRAYAQRASAYWFQFARTGAPASPGSPTWPGDDGRQDKTMLFGETVIVQTNFMKARLDTLIGVTKIIDRVLNRE